MNPRLAFIAAVVFAVITIGWVHSDLLHGPKAIAVLFILIVGGVVFANSIKSMFPSSDPYAKQPTGTATAAVLSESKDEAKKRLLMLGARIGDLDTVRQLVESDKSMLDAKDSEGKTALMVSTIEGKVKVVQYLLSAGVDISIRDNSNKAAIDYLDTSGNEEVSKLFIEHSRPKPPVIPPER